MAARTPSPAILAVMLMYAASVVAVEFRVAEIKPHFGCTSPEGQENVREYIHGLVNQRYGLVALIQTEFHVPQPLGYSAFGASCVYNNPDAAVVLFNQAIFEAVQPLGTTILGSYDAMPYLSDGCAPANGSSCMGDPGRDGERAYTGAVLRVTESGEELCVVAATFPHRQTALGRKFLREFKQSCETRPVLFIVDTNADGTSMDQLGKVYGDAWGNCSDPGANGAKTCCHDIKRGVPNALFKFDRTALCNGGSVEDWAVETNWFCDADEEHHFTTAMVVM